VRAVDCRQQVTGELHATAVSDGHLTIEIHPETGGAPITVTYRPDQAADVRAGLCRRVTVHGTMRQRAFDASHLDLESIESSTESALRAA
jgi:hypothetical protein